jgi:Domain of Unknown Function with PDB structure (DUF3858)
VTAVESSDPRDLDAPIEVRVEARVPRLLQSSGDGQVELHEVKSWLFDLIYLRGRSISSFAADPIRRHDVSLPVPSGVDETVIYELPPGHSVQSLPEPIQLQTEFGTYERVYEQEGHTLRARRVLRVRTNRIPVERYEAFRSFLGDIERAERERPVLRRGDPDQ